MSENQQHIDPDVIAAKDTEEELIKQCEEMWKDVEECQNKLSLIGPETLTNSNAQLSLLIMQVKCLTAELGQWNKRKPETVPLTEGVLLTLGKEEFQKLRYDLEMVRSIVQSENEKLKEDLAREQQWLDEQQQILETLNVLHSDLKNRVVTFTESRIFNELKAKILSIKEFKEKLLLALGDFLEDHFPLPDGNTQKKRKNIQELNTQLITLNEMLEVPLLDMGSTIESCVFPSETFLKKTKLHLQVLSIGDSFWIRGGFPPSSRTSKSRRVFSELNELVISNQVCYLRISTNKYFLYNNLSLF
ncbi:SoxLZ/Sox6 leucine zipper binding protein in testis (predicted), isoform CRA_a [Rattus norvegicus]|uniref:SoxLZ/Sox6 leucine zipper binding protein in testis (Predicted), isoform CRA_a n=1 Tax=Rattus norvegicus TaxID=10116 RepID=A6I5F8_RAT|nr:SoxLZ/Sox6 leucine zipper binding protein in testis (predicted), isoform CRA_a [Rattus norvegicus]|eukprot:NP_001099877.1 centromere protein K [Rattus norvegicus]